jgi:hypothetical protein
MVVVGLAHSSLRATLQGLLLVLLLVLVVQWRVHSSQHCCIQSPAKVGGVGEEGVREACRDSTGQVLRVPSQREG